MIISKAKESTYFKQSLWAMYICDLVKEIAERQSKVQNGILELMKWYKDEQKETSKNENKTALEISLSKDKKKSKLYSGSL